MWASNISVNFGDLGVLLMRFDQKFGKKGALKCKEKGLVKNWHRLVPER